MREMITLSEAMAYPDSSTKRKLFETKTQAERPGHCPANVHSESEGNFEWFWWYQPAQRKFQPMEYSGT